MRAAGAQVDHYPSRPGLSDMVFPTDVAVVDGDRFLRARFRHPERRAEAAHGAAWLVAQGAQELHWPDDPDIFLEGGDTVACGGVMVCGTGPRTSPGAAQHVGQTLGAEVVTVPLVDPRFYHLDMSFCPLDERRAICAPDAWSERGRRAVADLVPEPLIISSEEALTFCANSVVIGDTVVMPSCPPRVADQLAEWGYRVLVCRVDEFLKAGGGIRCMALDLDLFRRAPARPARGVPAEVPH
ncbi:dimethylarginine dimethylaminohydrolase family protein [Streptomyces cyaneofuscatus]|uniref:dimethylarginine dimethylaminohydrolase family protein n=1 Tax=Streptomyces cyaneofuscatus TaxID=66883 RepID=UPI003437992F